MSREKPNTLKMTTRFELMKLVQNEYVESGMNDTEFAAYAAAKTGHPFNKEQVRYIRSEFGLPTPTFKPTGTVASRLTFLERELASLKLRIETYFGDTK